MGNRKFQQQHFDILYSQEEFRPYYYFIRRKQAQLVYEFSKSIDKNGRMLDIGCGLGSVESYLQHLPINKLKEIIGVDISEVAINRAQGSVRDERVKFIRMGFEDIEKLGKFHVVVCFEFIEHIIDSSRLINLVYETLEENGYFILSTPNRIRMENRIRKLFQKKEVLIDPSHVREYAFSELKSLLEKGGFRLEYMATYGLWGGWIVYYFFPFFPKLWKKSLAEKSFLRGESRINYWVGKLPMLKNSANFICLVAKKRRETGERIGVIPNEDFSSYFPQYTFEERENYFNPNLKFETHIVSLNEKKYRSTTRMGTLIIHPVPFVLGKFIRIFLRFFKAIWIVKKYRVDLVRTYNTLQYGLIAMLAAKINRKPFVLSLHSDYDRAIRNSGKNYFFWHTLEKIVMKNATVVIGVSPYLVEYAKKHGARDVVVIPNPVNLKPFLTTSENTQNVRNKYQLNEKIVLLFVGRYYDPAKNFARLLQAFSQLETELRENTHLLVIGRGGEKEAYFRNLVSCLDLGKDVSFIGFLSHSELPAYYQACDIFVSPSIYEGLPTSLVEAMASGLPALTSNHPSMTYLISPENGMVVNPYSVKEITAGLKYLVQMDKDRRKELGERGREKVAIFFGEEKVYDQIERLYLNLIKRKV